MLPREVEMEFAWTVVPRAKCNKPWSTIVGEVWYKLNALLMLSIALITAQNVPSFGVCWQLFSYELYIDWLLCSRPARPTIKMYPRASSLRGWYVTYRTGRRTLKSLFATYWWFYSKYTATIQVNIMCTFSDKNQKNLIVIYTWKVSVIKI